MLAAPRLKALPAWVALGVLSVNVMTRLCPVLTSGACGTSAYLGFQVPRVHPGNVGLVAHIPKSGRMANIALVALSLVISLILPELGYRVYLAISDPLAPERWSWWLTPTADGDFDAEFGQKLAPELSIHVSIVRNGVVVACLGDVIGAISMGSAGRRRLATTPALISRSS